MCRSDVDTITTSEANMKKGEATIIPNFTYEFKIWMFTIQIVQNILISLMIIKKHQHNENNRVI